MHTYNNSQFLKLIYKFIKPFNITNSILYWLLIIFLLYQGISNLIHPENFIERLKSIIAFNDDILILISISINLLQIVIALMLIFKLHLKASLMSAIILFNLISFIYFYNSVEIIPVVELFPEIIILNHRGVTESLLNILFFIIALLLLRTKKNS